MTVSPSQKKELVLTPEAFAGLLAALDPDEARAAEEYEAVRRQLVRLFQGQGQLQGDGLQQARAD